MINYIKANESTRNKNGKENGKIKKKKGFEMGRKNKMNKNKIQTKLGRFELHIQIGNK